MEINTLDSYITENFVKKKLYRRTSKCFGWSSNFDEKKQCCIEHYCEE